LLHEQSENTIEVPLVSNKARLIKSAFIKNVLLISMCSYVLNSTEEINVQRSLREKKTCLPSSSQMVWFHYSSNC